jgi:hypothetical protein
VRYQCVRLILVDHLTRFRQQRPKSAHRRTTKVGVGVDQ